MPRIAKELSALEVSRICDQGLHFVGNVPGLILQVKGASRSWILRIPIGGKRRDVGLGGYPAIGLAQARNSARDIRIKVVQGIDPIQERRNQQAALRVAQGKLKTFNEVASGFLEDRSPGWQQPKASTAMGEYTRSICRSRDWKSFCEGHRISTHSKYLTSYMDNQDRNCVSGERPTGERFRLGQGPWVSRRRKPCPLEGQFGYDTPCPK